MVEYIYFCEGPRCDTNQKSLAKAPIRGWVCVQEKDINDQVTVHDFCGWECVMQFSAQLPPPESIDMEEKL